MSTQPNQDAQSANPADVRAYLEHEAETPNGWLRRHPRYTHPAIVRLVRAAQAGGIHYDTDTVDYVADRAAVPDHLREQLGHETYVAKGIIRDDDARAQIDAALAEGYAPIADLDLRDGDRYLVRFGTTYVGRDTPDYSAPKRMRVKAIPGGGFALMPHGARTRGYAVPSDGLAKPA